jgi:hypothetical protein
VVQVSEAQAVAAAAEAMQTEEGEEPMQAGSSREGAAAGKASAADGKVVVPAWSELSRWFNIASSSLKAVGYAGFFGEAEVTKRWHCSAIIFAC